MVKQTEIIDSTESDTPTQQGSHEGERHTVTGHELRSVQSGPKKHWSKKQT